MKLSDILIDHSRTRNSQLAAYALTCLLTILVVGQLFNLEDFISMIKSYNLFSSDLINMFLAIKVIALEILALPFLLSIFKSTSLKVYSLILGWVAVLFWLLVAIMSVYSLGYDGQLGFWFAKMPIVTSWQAIILSLILVILNIWASWGLWPIRKVIVKKDVKNN